MTTNTHLTCQKMLSLLNIQVFILIFANLILISHQNTAIIKPVLNSLNPFQTQIQGSRFFLNCVTILGDSPLTFHWMKNGHKILDDDNDHIHIRKDNLMSTLLIENLSSNDSGNYTCSVNNRGGFDSQSSYLNVQGFFVKSCFFAKNFV